MPRRSDLGRLLLAGTPLAVTCLVSATAARAADYCVARSGCPAARTYAAAHLQQALDAAAATPEHDRLLVGPGRFVGLFYYLDPSPLEVAGAGVGRTVIQPPPLNAGLQLSPSTVLHDVGFRIVASGSYGFTTHGVVRDVRVTGAPGVVDATGAALFAGAAATRLDVTLPAGRGIFVGGAATYRAGRVRVGTGGGSIGIEVHANIALERLRITARDGLVLADGSTTIADTQIDLGTAAGARGIVQGEGAQGQATVMCRADRVTIIGHDRSTGGSQTAVDVRATNTGETVGMTFENSVIAGVRRAFARTATAGYAFVGVHHSVSSSGLLDDQNAGAGTGTIEALDVFSVRNPRLVRVGSDSLPRWDSPLIDAYAASYLQLGPTDLAGHARVVDGDGKQGAVADIGAFEYGRHAPRVTRLRATRVATRTLRLAATATDADPGEHATGTWRFGDGKLGRGLSVRHTFAKAGRYRVRFTATDPAGRTATRTATVLVRAG